MDQLLLLGYGLLILGCLLLARLPATGHGADDGTDSGSFAGISRNRANGRAARGSSGSAAKPLPSAHRWTGLLRRRARSHCRRIDPRVLFRPGVTLRVVLFLLRGALAFRGIDDRLLRGRGSCQCERYKLEQK
jgi:hypothetical protein